MEEPWATLVQSANNRVDELRTELLDEIEKAKADQILSAINKLTVKVDSLQAKVDEMGDKE